MSYEERTSRPDYIHNLNDDCLAKIFSYLPLHERFTIQAVCKRWNSALAWSGIRSLDFNHHYLSKFLSRGDKGVEKILEKCGHSLQELNLGYIGRSRLLPIVSLHCHNLIELKIRLQSNDRDYLEWYPEMERLQHLTLTGNRRHLTEHFFETLPHQNLTELHLAVCESRFDFPSVSAEALENLTGLSALTLDNFILTSDTVRMISRMSHLTFLSIACSTFKERPPQLDNLTNLEHLDLSFTFPVDDRFIREVSQHCKNLQVLKLNGNITVTDKPLSNLHYLKKLECEYCFRVNNDGIITLLKNAPKLEYLNLNEAGVNSNVLTEAKKIIRRRTKDDVTLRIDIHYAAARRWNPFRCPPLLNVKIRR